MFPKRTFKRNDVFRDERGKRLSFVGDVPAVLYYCLGCPILRLTGGHVNHLFVPCFSSGAIRVSVGKGMGIMRSYLLRWNRSHKYRYPLLYIPRGTFRNHRPRKRLTQSFIPRPKPCRGRSKRSFSVNIFVGSKISLLPFRPFQGIYEWEAALNISTGKVYYVNNVNYTNVRNTEESPTSSTYSAADCSRTTRNSDA